MLKLGLWIGTPSLVTLVASSNSLLLEDIQLIFALSLAAIVVAIVPRISDKAGPR